MILTEVVDLITIREYIVNTINNPVLSKEKVNELSGILILLDNKIVSILRSTQFKTYIEYDKVKEAIKEASQESNFVNLWQLENNPIYKK